MKQFLLKNKVFLLGLAGAVTVVLQQFISQPVIDWTSIGFAAGAAALSYVANEWRGQGLTITGIVGTLAAVLVQNFNGGHLDTSKLILLSIAALLSAVAPPPKSQAYEEHPTILRAKDN